MPNALVVHFSIAGSTRSVAERVALGLQRGGFVTEVAALAPAAAALPQIPPDVDLLAVGSPTHYFRLPTVVSGWLGGLPRLDGVRSLSFVTYGTDFAAAGNQLRGLLADRGCVLAGHRAQRGADLFLPYLRRGWLFSAGLPAEAALGAAEDWAARAARGLEDVPELDGPTHWAYAIERALFWQPLVPRFWARRFHADPGLCDGCGICVRRCPMGNVSQAERGGLPSWGRSCLLCLECELRCPLDAVRSPTRWPAFRPFIAYNVRRAVADPRIDRVRVRVERGKVVEMGNGAV
jgi:ferredoxin